MIRYYNVEIFPGCVKYRILLGGDTSCVLMTLYNGMQGVLMTKHCRVEILPGCVNDTLQQSADTPRLC